ncbi:MAG: ATP-dependent Clp protease adaptor ClpS [Chitinophagales bacterium]
MSAVLTEEKIDVQEIIDDLLGAKLVVHNDNVNTFEWVIVSLVEICDHSWEQAEQCAYIIHYSGKYAVLSGGKEKLSPMRHALVDRGINATLE